MIGLKNLNKNKLEIERLKELEHSNVELQKEQERKMKTHMSRTPKENPDDSKMNLLNQSSVFKPNEARLAISQRPSNRFSDVGNMESEFEQQFLQLTDLVEMDRTYLEQTTEKFDETSFDAFTFCQILSTHSLEFMMFRIAQTYNFFGQYMIDLERIMYFAKEVQAGYFAENPYHNVTHLIDSMQAMHYLMTVANIKKFMKKNDIFAAFIANAIHDYEHPGFSNQFVIRTKHPLAIRYSDQSVLENHHLAAAMSMILKTPETNIFGNLHADVYQEIRKTIINVVLGTEFSRHFSIITEIKTKLGNNFPTDSSEDRTLIL